MINCDSIIPLGFITIIILTQREPNEKVSLLTLLCVISSVSHADDQYEEYLRKLDEQQKAATAGWHWYNDDVKQDEEEEQAPQQPTVPAEPTKPESKETELTAEWLNENIPKLLNSAINNPTPENLKTIG